MSFGWAPGPANAMYVTPLPTPPDAVQPSPGRREPIRHAK